MHSALSLWCSSQSEMKLMNLCGCSRTHSSPELTGTRNSLVRDQVEIMCLTRSDHSGSVYIYIQKECGTHLNPPSCPAVGGMMSKTCLFLLEQVTRLLLCGIWHWFGTVADNLPSSLSGDLAFLDKGTSDRMGAIVWIYKFTARCLFTYLLLTPTVNARSFLPDLAVLRLRSTKRCR